MESFFPMRGSSNGHIQNYNCLSMGYLHTEHDPYTYVGSTLDSLLFYVDH